MISFLCIGLKIIVVVSQTTHSLVFSPPMDILKNATDGLPDAIPFSSGIKSFTKTLANESPGKKLISVNFEIVKYQLNDPFHVHFLSKLTTSHMCARFAHFDDDAAGASSLYILNQISRE